MTNEKRIKNERNRMVNSMSQIDAVLATMERGEQSRLLAIAKTHIETASLYLEKAGAFVEVDLTTKSFA